MQTLTENDVHKSLSIYRVLLLLRCFFLCWIVFSFEIVDKVVPCLGSSPKFDILSRTELWSFWTIIKTGLIITAMDTTCKPIFGSASSFFCLFHFGRFLLAYQMFQHHPLSQIKGHPFCTEIHLQHHQIGYPHPGWCVVTVSCFCWWWLIWTVPASC